MTRSETGPAWLILPTYNEAENVEPFVAAARAKPRRQRYTRLLLGVEVRDLTGGFKCFRREVLEAIDLDSIQARGYAFQVEMTYRASARASPSSRSRSSSATPRRRLEDGPLDPGRGGLAGTADEIWVQGPRKTPNGG